MEFLHDQYSSLIIDYEAHHPIYTEEQVESGLVDLAALPCGSDLAALPCGSIDSGVHSTEPQPSTSAERRTPEFTPSIEELEQDLLLRDHTVPSPTFSEIFEQVQHHLRNPTMGTPKLLASSMPSVLAQPAACSADNETPPDNLDDDVEMDTEDNIPNTEVSQVWSTLGSVAKPESPIPFDVHGSSSDCSSDDDGCDLCFNDDEEEPSTPCSRRNVDRCRTVDRLARLICYVKTMISHAGISETLFYPAIRSAIEPILLMDLSPLGNQYRPKLLPTDHPDHPRSSLFSTDRKLSDAELYQMSELVIHDICHLKQLALHGGHDGCLYNPFNLNDPLDMTVK